VVDVRPVDSDWLWLVDDSVEPAPDALERLLGVLDDLGPLLPPALLASRVVTTDGPLDPASTPVLKVTDPDLAAAAAQWGLVSLRVAPAGSLLVRRSDLPRRPDDSVEWTARLLKEAPGYLVPASVAVRRAPAAGHGFGRRLALLRGDALAAGEKPWFGFRLMEDALAAAVARRGGRAGSRPRSPR
jgi:hypothetical protein